jgi:hypothetical protein
MDIECESDIEDNKTVDEVYWTREDDNNKVRYCVFVCMARNLSGERIEFVGALDKSKI